MLNAITFILFTFLSGADSFVASRGVLSVYFLVR